MESVYVTRCDDTMGLEAIAILQSEGYQTRVLDLLENTRTQEIAIFGTTRHKLGSGANNNYLRAASHRLIPPEICPPWAKNTSLLLAVFNTKSKHDTDGFEKAVKQIALRWKSWFPGKSGELCPWGVLPENQNNLHLFSKWASRAAEEVTGAVTAPIIINSHGVTITYGNEALVNWQRPQQIYVMGCVPFNAPHTDVASALHPQKAHTAQQSLSWLLNDLWRYGLISGVTFVVAGREMVTHPALKQSLHPFFWPAVCDIESKLGQSFAGETRAFGHMGERDDNQVAMALELGRHIIVRDIVDPISHSVDGLPVDVIRWTDYFEPGVLDEAFGIAQTPEAIRLAEGIYYPRVKARDWYQTVETAMGSGAGLARTIANNAVYIANVLQMNIDGGVMLDVEVDDQYWFGLRPVIEELRQSDHLIMSMPKNVCQPWT